MKKFHLIILALVLISCDPKAPSVIVNEPINKASYQMISVELLAKELQTKDFLFINVHIPLEGNIPGTDLEIAFDKIGAQISMLPNDKNAKIILYCRSGAMGNTAAQTLVDLGFTNVFNLEGGYTAWKAAGHQFSQ